MSSVNVEEFVIGAGYIWRSGVRISLTRENNICRIIKTIAAPVLNGVGGIVEGTDYRTERDRMEIEFTPVELSAAMLGLVTPGATITADGNDYVIGESATRRVPLSAYEPWDLRVPGLDGSEVRFEIHKGIALSNAEFTAQDSEVPLGARITIASRILRGNLEASAWAIRKVAATGS